MEKYVDGFVLVIPDNKEAEYTKSICSVLHTADLKWQWKGKGKVFERS
jgi:hypothetical protein